MYIVFLSLCVYINVVILSLLQNVSFSVKLIECTDCSRSATSNLSEIFIVSKKFQNNSNNVPFRVIFPLDEKYRSSYRLVPIESQDKMTLASINSQYFIKRGWPVQKGTQPDDLADFFLFEIEKHMGTDIVTHKKLVGNYINPNIMKMCHQYTLVTCNTWSIVYKKGNSNEWIMKVADRRINFQQYEQGVAQCDTKSNSSVLGLSDCATDLNIELVGQDPRLFILNETHAFVLFNDERKFGRVTKYFQQIAWLNYDCTGSKNLTIYDYWSYINTPVESNSNQKNWVPFIADNQIHFIQYLEPNFLVTKLDSVDPSHMVSVVSTCDQRIHDYWPIQYGNLRGGTPAYLYNGTYLTFFHSVSQASIFRTYVFGAMLFSAKPPYKVLKITPFPIADYWSYQGEWSLFIQTRRTDYVLFPINFQIHKDKIHLSLGRQDKEGWLYELSYPELVDTMVPVDQTCYEKKNRKRFRN